jgi:hypothetical protein
LSPSIAQRADLLVALVHALVFLDREPADLERAVEHVGGDPALAVDLGARPRAWM